MNLQELEKRVKCDNTEGIKHGTDHPYLYHLDTGSHGQRLGHANETREKIKSTFYEYLTYKVAKTKRRVRLTSMTISI